MASESGTAPLPNERLADNEAVLRKRSLRIVVINGGDTSTDRYYRTLVRLIKIWHGVTVAVKHSCMLALYTYATNRVRIDATIADDTNVVGDSSRYGGACRLLPRRAGIYSLTRSIRCDDLQNLFSASRLTRCSRSTALTHARQKVNASEHWHRTTSDKAAAMCICDRLPIDR